MNTLTLSLQPDQIKQVVKEAIIADPQLLETVLKEIKNESNLDAKFNKAVDDIFDRYDDVFKALA